VNGAIQEDSDAVITTAMAVIISLCCGRRLGSRALPAAGETATPPEVGAPLTLISERIRQSTLDVRGVQGSHPTPQFLASTRRQLLQYLIKDVPRVPHIVKGTPATRALRSLRVQGAASWR
jgi:hypothetical protein